MKNNTGIVVIVFICLLIVLIPILGYFPTYKNNKQEERKEYYPIIAEALFFYGGSYKVTYDKVELSQENFYDPMKAKIVVGHYNYYNNSDLTYDGLKAEFENFCDGSGTYKNLIKFADHYKKYDQLSFNDMTVDNIRMDYFIEQVCAYFDKKYAESTAYMDEHSSLTDEEINQVCESMLSKKENLYRAVIYSDTDKRCDLTYPLFYCEFDESQIETDKSGQKFVKVDDTEIYYLEYGNIDLISDEEEWYVSEIIIFDSSDKTIISASIGESKETIKTRLERQIMEGVNIISDTGDTLVCAQGPYHATIDFENGVSVKITLEIKE